MNEIAHYGVFQPSPSKPSSAARSKQGLSPAEAARLRDETNKAEKYDDFRRKGADQKFDGASNLHLQIKSTSWSKKNGAKENSKPFPQGRPHPATKDRPKAYSREFQKPSEGQEALYNSDVYQFFLQFQSLGAPGQPPSLGNPEDSSKSEIENSVSLGKNIPKKGAKHATKAQRKLAKQSVHSLKKAEEATYKRFKLSTGIEPSEPAQTSNSQELKEKAGSKSSQGLNQLGLLPEYKVITSNNYNLLNIVHSKETPYFFGMGQPSNYNCNAGFSNAIKKPQPPRPMPKMFKCPLPVCGKIFFDRASLKKHSTVHGDKLFQCTFKGCNKRFLDNAKLKRHMLVHTGEKPYQCHICFKRFSLDFNLKTHMRIHTGEKPFICPFPGCNKRFNQKSNLHAHQQTHHQGEDIIPPFTPNRIDLPRNLRNVDDAREFLQAHGLDFNPYEFFEICQQATKDGKELVITAQCKILPKHPKPGSHPGYQPQQSTFSHEKKPFIVTKCMHQEPPANPFFMMSVADGARDPYLQSFPSDPIHNFSYYGGMSIRSSQQTMLYDPRRGQMMTTLNMHPRYADFVRPREQMFLCKGENYEWASRMDGREGEVFTILIRPRRHCRLHLDLKEKQ